MRIVTYLFIIFAIGVSLWLRTLNMRSLDGMLLGTDPIRFLRQSHLIAEHSRMPPNDMMRAFPVGRSSNTELTFFPYLTVYIHRLLSLLFPELSLNQVATLYPVAFFVIACLILYMLSKELIDRNVALLVISLAVVVPALVKRTQAGFADRDILSLVLGITSYYFYIKAYKLDSLWKRLCTISVSGIFMGLLGLTWQGVAIFSLVVVGTEGIMLIFGGYSKKELYIYSAWLIPVLLILILPKHVYRDMSEPFVLTAVVVPGAFLVFGVIYFFLYQIIESHLSKRFVSFTALGISAIVILVSIIFYPISASLILRIWQGIQYPLGTGRLFKLIEELQSQGFINWFVWPGCFFLAVLGGVFLLACRLASGLGINRWLTAIVLQVAIAIIVLSRVLSGVYKGKDTFVTNIVYICSLSILSAAIIGVAIHIHCRKKKRTVSLDRKVLFPLIYLIITLMFARAANRFEFFLAPILLIIGCYAVRNFLCWLVGDQALNRVILCIVAILVIWELYTLISLEFTISSRWYRGLFLIMMFFSSCGLCWVSLHQMEPKRTRVYRVLTKATVLIVTIALISLSAVTPYSYARRSYMIVRRSKPLIDSEMQEAFSQLRKHTSEDAVVAASWEWGSAINLIAKRATIVDEAQIPYWVYLMSRHVIMGQTEREALKFLKAHQATHLMLTNRDIYLLPEASYVGSNSSLNRQISLPVYGSLVQHVESDTGTTAFRYGTLNPVFTPEVIALLTEDASKFWMLGGIYLAVDESNNSHLQSAIVEFQHEARVLRFPPQEIYFRKHLIHNEGKVAPCTILIDAKSDNPFEWVILYLSPIARNSLAVRLYLLDEPSKFFLPIYSSADPKGQFIKVWQIKYPTDIIADCKYLKLDFPEPEPK